jgi:lipopolysaccharide transport system permease protein
MRYLKISQLVCSLNNFFNKYKLQNNIELLYLLVRKELTLRYANSALGYLWALLIPLAFITTYFVAFKIVMRAPWPNYIPFLAVGMFPWLWMVNGIVQATPIFRHNQSLVKKVKVPCAILPLAIVVKEMLHYIFALPILIGFVFFGAHILHWSWLWLVPLMLIIQTCFVYSIAALFALCQVFIRDIEHLIGITMNIVFFITPVIYPISKIPENYQKYFLLNPFAPFIETWHAIWLEGNIGNYHNLMLCFIYTFVIGTFTFLMYKKFIHRIGEWL